MKVNKMVTIDYELVEKLKESGVNLSGLINKLLTKHVKDDGWRNLSPEELDIAIKKEEARVEYEAKIKQLEASI